MDTSTTMQRQTKYCLAIRQELAGMGHATNSELLDSLRKVFPTLSATTVHRATARLASRDHIAIAPSAKDGSLQYDTNTKPHDHFQCSQCGLLKDTDIKDKVIPVLEASIGDCSVSGQLTISGICNKCIKKEK